MESINILILSVGRRVELVQCFKNAAMRLNINSKVIAGDSSDDAPALYFADSKVMLPLIDNPIYITSIIELCIKYDVALVVPTIDTDLLMLAKNREKIKLQSGARVLVSDTDVVSICRDKIKSQKYFEMNNFGAPKLYSEEEIINRDIEYPAFIKPISGSSSINAFKVNNEKELETYLQIIDEPIIQSFIPGEEFSVDVFLDFNSKIISIVPRLRIATRSGEISKGKIIKDPFIIEDVTKLMHSLKPIGFITVQLKKTMDKIKYIEINPRFGGGAPMSIKSGADACEWLYRLLMGEELDYFDSYRDNILFLRFDNSICINEEMELDD